MKKIVIAGLLIIASSTAYSGLYRWVDASGEVHFSDKVPASASKKGHAELDSRGVTRKVVNPEEIKKAREEKALLLAAKKEQQRLEQLQRKKNEKIIKRDTYLLTTFEDENDLIHYFENKINLIIGNSKILKAQRNKLNKKVIKLEKRKSATKHKATVKTLQTKIIDINATIKQYEKALQDNEKEMAKLTKNYRADLQRFIELTQ